MGRIVRGYPLAPGNLTSKGLPRTIMDGELPLRGDLPGRNRAGNTGDSPSSEGQLINRAVGWIGLRLFS